VTVGLGRVADNEAARELVEAVWGENRGCLGAERGRTDSPPRSRPAVRATIEASAVVVMWRRPGPRLRCAGRRLRVAGGAGRACVGRSERAFSRCRAPPG